MSKKELVLNALNNKKVDRVPVGFWFHFAEGEEFNQGLEREEVLQKNIEGHRRFFKETQPDFMKLMSDGFFEYPNEVLKRAGAVHEIAQITPIGRNHPWIEKQVQLVKSLTDIFGKDIATFYNIFSPATTFKILLGNSGKNRTISDYFKEDKGALKATLEVISVDLSTLAERVILEGGADGIYLSVQNIQDSSVTANDYINIIAPSELNVLAGANRVSENNILHICGYEGAKNHLTVYRDYDAKAVNWAVNIENFSLGEGKKFFGNRAVIGGFDNTAEGILYRGTREEIEQFTEKLLKESGRTGVILGADCTVPKDIEWERFSWVRETAGRISAAEAIK